MESLWDGQTSEEWQSRLRILNERVDDVATKTSSMLAKSCSLNDASKGLKDQGRKERSNTTGSGELGDIYRVRRCSRWAL